MLNVLYSLTPPGGNYTRDMIFPALDSVMDFFNIPIWKCCTGCLENRRNCWLLWLRKARLVSSLPANLFRTTVYPPQVPYSLPCVACSKRILLRRNRAYIRYTTTFSESGWGESFWYCSGWILNQLKVLWKFYSLFLKKELRFRLHIIYR